MLTGEFCGAFCGKRWVATKAQNYAFCSSTKYMPNRDGIVAPGLDAVLKPLNGDGEAEGI